MKKTIKEDRERNIIKSELLNDNTLLEYVAEKRDIVIGIRFVESPTKGIREQILLRVDVAEFTDHIGQLIQVNEDKTAIAIFKPLEDSYMLEQVYDLEEHTFGIPEFLDLHYQKKFPNAPLKKQYYKEKK